MDGLQRVANLSQQQSNFTVNGETPESDTATTLDQDGINTVELETKFDQARTAMLALQNPDGHWCFPLEADCTIPAEYILMMHFMDEIDVILENKIARFIRDKQDMTHGGWPLYYGGAFDISCTIKSYYALKLVGDSTDAPHMVRAREAIMERGGAAKANVFT
ncbi:MAG: squalene--hopene cyclase, partial [Nitrosomonadaceae bacterium]|nr:squalene--hopene cyclase [Nitrosomonadaceae bacterium]